MYVFLGINKGLSDNTRKEYLQRQRQTQGTY